MARQQPPNTQGSGIIGAVIIGGAILAGSLLIHNGLRETSKRLEAIESGLRDTREELTTLAPNRPAAPAAQAAPARRGPDPDKVYTIATAGAPSKGSPQAKVELIEFSDFQ